MCCWLIFIHLSYYILARRIRILKSYLSDDEIRRSRLLSTNETALPMRLDHFNWSYYCSQHETNMLFDFFFYREEQDIGHKLRTVQNVFDILCQFADELNSFNSAILIIFITKIMNFIFSLYVFIRDNEILGDSLKVFLTDFVFFWVIFTAASSSVNEVNSVFSAIQFDVSTSFVFW